MERELSPANSDLTPNEVEFTGPLQRLRCNERLGGATIRSSCLLMN